MFTIPTLIHKSGLYLLLALFTCQQVKAQDPSCACRKTLEEVIQKTTTNYPGYPIIINASNQHYFHQLTDSLRIAADTANDLSCFSILQTWISYFRDKHLALVFKDSPENTDLIRHTFANAPRYNLSKDSLVRSWQPGKDLSLEGIWAIHGLYEVAIVKDKDRYLGIITTGDNIYWTQGQVKFELIPQGDHNYLGILYNRLHLADTFHTYIDDNTYSLDLKGSLWNRTYPALPAHYKGIPADSFYFAKIDSNTTILRLPSFDLKYKVLIDSLITSNFQTITHTDHFIIDLRGNMGGYNLCYEKLLPLIHTDTVISEGGLIQATEENIGLYKEVLQNPSFPQHNKLLVTKLIDNLNKHKNGLFLAAGDTTAYAPGYAQPGKVGLLMNEGCGSAAEFLILDAKQSKKVTLFGKRSTGAVDYVNLVGPRALSCSRYILWCPTARSTRLPQHPLNNTGIIPDVDIPNHVNWINFVQQYLENQEI